MKPIDPSPVPSFRGVAPPKRAGHLAKRRAGVEAVSKEAMLVTLIDALLEASLPEAEQHRRCAAVDWTDHESWARPTAKLSGEISADPDAAWGHAKRNAPGAKDALFLGLLRPGRRHRPRGGSKAGSRAHLPGRGETCQHGTGRRDGRAPRAHGQFRCRTERRARRLRLFVQDRFQPSPEKHRGRARHGPASFRPRPQGHLRRRGLREWEPLLPVRS